MGLSDCYETVGLLYDGSITVVHLSAAPLFVNGAFAGSFSIITRGHMESIQGTGGTRRILALFEIDPSASIVTADEGAEELLRRRGLSAIEPLRALVRDEERARFDRALGLSLAGASAYSTVLDLADDGSTRRPVQWSFSPVEGRGAARVARVVLSGIYEPAPPKPPDVAFYERYSLSDRERDIADLLVAGQRYKEIAWRLGIGLPTVRSHVMNAYRKMGVHSIDDLRGLISQI